MRIKKTALVLLLIFLVALSLRIYSANHLDVGTDEMIYSIIPLNIISADRLGTVEQSPLFFYLTDISYKLFGGMTALSLRFASVFFGALTVFLIFLITNQLFSKKKMSLLSAFLFAVSGYVLNNNFEMDMASYFFVFLGLYFLLRSFNGKDYNFYFCALSVSLAVMIKSISFIFIPIFILSWLIFKFKKSNDDSSYRNKLRKRAIKNLLIFGIISLIVVVPIFSYNYLIYQEKGIGDYYFSNILGIGETVHTGMLGKPWGLDNFLTISSGKIVNFLKSEPIIFVFGLLGMLYLLFNRKSYYTILNSKKAIHFLFIFSLLLPFLYLAGQTGSSNHYIWISGILSVFAAYLIIVLAEKIKHKFNFKYFSSLIVVLVLISTFFVLQDIKSQRDQSISLSLREYTHENIPNNAVVVIDPRIYRGIHAWVFNDKHYLEGTHFSNLVEQVKDVPNKVTMPLYYIECGPGTNCGWKPEDFQRVYDTGEQISTYFRENTPKVGEVKATHHFLIYQGQISLPHEALEAIDQTHQFWFYPVGWKYPEQAVDYYQAEGFGKVVEGVGFLILWIDVIIAILAIPFVFYLVFRKRRNSFNF